VSFLFELEGQPFQKKEFVGKDSKSFCPSLALPPMSKTLLQPECGLAIPEVCYPKLLQPSVSCLTDFTSDTADVQAIDRATEVCRDILGRAKNRRPPPD
jgi:hypothetical protein